MAVSYRDWDRFNVFKWKQVTIFSIQLLLFVLWIAVCRFIMIFFCNYYEVCWLKVIFQVLYLGDTINEFIRILFLRILRNRLRRYFYAILEVKGFWANINIGKQKARPKLQWIIWMILKMNDIFGTSKFLVFLRKKCLSVYDTY